LNTNANISNKAPVEIVNGQLKRTIDWKQGLASALGAPILILPSIGYFAGLLWSSTIVIWILSVIQGALQNVAYAELATTFPKSSGLPGYTQTILGRNKSEHHIAKLMGGLGAWGYLIGWSFVPSIFALQFGTYLQKLLPVFSEVSQINLSLTAGAIIFLALFLINFKGLGNSSKLAYLLAAVSLIPLIAISVAPLITGNFKVSNITGSWLPPNWHWDPIHFMLIFGIFGMAEWSACASEAAAVYGPEYKNPRTDVIKALFICGIICFITYSSVQTVATGTLGINGILGERLSPLFPLAQVSFGSLGVYLTILMLMAAMILLIQMASLTAARAMHSMSIQGNLPSVFSRTNKHGTPVVTMIIIFCMNELLILVKSPEAILAASAFGYMLAHGITLYSYVKAKRDPELAKLPRSFRAPRGWVFVALIYGIFTLPFCFVGLLFLNSLYLGWTSTWIGLGALAIYIPLWFFSRRKVGNGAG
jgi:amino acid transporter